MEKIENNIVIMQEDIKTIETDVKNLSKSIDKKLEDNNNVLLEAISMLFVKSNKENADRTQGLMEASEERMRIYGDMYKENRDENKGIIVRVSDLEDRVQVLERV